MKQIYAAALLVLAIVLASCAPEPPPYFTWCYSYDFYNSVDGINIISGDWVDGTGIVTDEDGLIQVNWVEDVDYVDLNQLVVWVQRGAPGSNTFRVSANGIIFGIAAAFDEQFPPYPAPSDFSGRIPVSSTPDPGSVFTNNANITIQADEPFILYRIEVRGIGPNPFGVNTCGDLTPTPEITLPPTVEPATPVATHTPTPTDTPDPVTFTPSPTPSATPTTQCVYWNGPDDTNFDAYGVDIVFSAAAGVTTESGNPAPSARSGYYAYEGGYHKHILYMYIQFPYEVPVITQKQFDFFHTNGPQGNYYTKITWTTNGTTPYTGYQLGGFGQYANGVWATQADYSHSPNLRTFSIALESNYNSATGPFMFVDNIVLCGTGLNPLPTHTPTPITPTSVPSQTPTATLTPMPSLTAGTPQATPTASRTAAPIYGPTYTYVLGTLPPNVPNTTPGTPVYTSTPLMTITVTPEGTPPEDGDSDGVFVPWGSYSGPDQTQSDIGEIGGALTNVTSNLFSLGSRYLGEFTGMIDQIVVGWRTSTPTVIPGMPRCQSDRLRSELCAIYYIIQYTILGDPLGTIVLQVAIIVIDLFIGVTFILLARSILEQLRRILHI